MEKETVQIAGTQNESNCQSSTSGPLKPTRRTRSQTRAMSCTSNFDKIIGGNVKSDSKCVGGVADSVSNMDVDSNSTDDKDTTQFIEQVINQIPETEIAKNFLKRKRGEGTPLPRANNADSYEASWSEVDKQRLIIALQRFGIMEIDKLLKAVPGKSEDDVRKYIKLKWKLARIELRANLKQARKKEGMNNCYLGPVDKWLEVLNEVFPNFDHYKTNPLARAVLLIWKYEKHPDPSECGGVDFKALYEHLYCTLCGYPPKHLNQPTANYLSESLKNFAHKMRTCNWLDVVKFVSSPMKIDTSRKAKDITDEDIFAACSYTKEQCFDELLKLPGFNPFCVPQDMLKKRAPESLPEAADASVTAAAAAAPGAAAVAAAVVAAAASTSTPCSPLDAEPAIAAVDVEPVVNDVEPVVSNVELVVDDVEPVVDDDVEPVVDVVGVEQAIAVSSIPRVIRTYSRVKSKQCSTTTTSKP